MSINVSGKLNYFVKNTALWASSLLILDYISRILVVLGIITPSSNTIHELESIRETILGYSFIFLPYPILALTLLSNTWSLVYYIAAIPIIIHTGLYLSVFLIALAPWTYNWLIDVFCLIAVFVTIFFYFLRLTVAVYRWYVSTRKNETSE